MNQRTWIAARHGIALVVLMGWAACATAQNVWTSQGPADLGATIDFAIVDSTVFAATWNGVFRSEDGGVHWRQSGLAGSWSDGWMRRPAARSSSRLPRRASCTARETEARAGRESSSTWRSCATSPSTRFRRPRCTSERATERFSSRPTPGRAGPNSPTCARDIDEFVVDREVMYILGFGEVMKSVDGGLTWENVAVPLLYPAGHRRREVGRSRLLGG